MKRKQELEDIFAIFHDGIIEDFKIESDKVELKICIEYLAELLDEKYEYLNITLLKIKSIQYDPWSDKPNTIDDWHQIFDLLIEIINVETDEKGQLVVHTSCRNAPDKSFQGGKLIIDCDDYTLSDQGNNKLSLSKLKDLSAYYWNEKFG